MTLQDATAWIARLFDVPADTICSETRREEIPTWDSLGMLTLIARLDEDFQILLAESDLDGLKAVGDILDVLQANGVLATAAAA